MYLNFTKNSKTVNFTVKIDIIFLAQNSQGNVLIPHKIFVKAAVSVQIKKKLLGTWRLKSWNLIFSKSVKFREKVDESDLIQNLKTNIFVFNEIFVVLTLFVLNTKNQLKLFF